MTHAEESPCTGQVQGVSEQLRSTFDVDFTTRRADAAARCAPLPCGRRDPDGAATDGAETEAYTTPLPRRPRRITLASLRDLYTDAHRSAEEQRRIVTHARALHRAHTERATA